MSTQTQCDEGARDGIDISYMVIMIFGFTFKGTTKIILLVTDGRTKDDIQAITEQMKTNDDVIVIAVGLYRAPLAELTQIATSDDLVFYTKDFHRIWNFFTQLTKKMCSLHPKGNDFQPHYLTFRQLPVNFRSTSGVLWKIVN